MNLDKLLTSLCAGLFTCRKWATVPQIIVRIKSYCLAWWEMQGVSNKWQQLLWPSTCPRGRGGVEAPGQDPCGLVSWRAREVPPLPWDSQQYLAYSSHPSLWLSVGDYLLLVPQSEKWKVLLWSLRVICATRTEDCSSPLPTCWYQHGRVHCLLHKLYVACLPDNW